MEPGMKSGIGTGIESVVGILIGMYMDSAMEYGTISEIEIAIETVMESDVIIGNGSMLACKLK